MVMKREDKTVKGYFQTPEREGASDPLKPMVFTSSLSLAMTFAFS